MVEPAIQRSITVKSGGMVQTFTGDPQLHVLSIGIYFISIHDPTAPSGRRTAWQQRVENGRAEGFKITMEGFDMGLKVGDRVRNRSGWGRPHHALVRDQAFFEPGTGKVIGIDSGVRHG
jgi:hypothetical protein